MSKKKEMSTVGKAISLVLVLLILTLLAGNAQEGLAQTPTEKVRIIKCGATLPLNSSMGVEIKKCMEIMVDLTNEAGGVVIGGQRYKFTWTCYDDKWTPDGGRAGAERLVYQDRVDFIVGELASPAILAQLPLFEEKKIPAFFWNSTDKIIDPQWHYTFKGTFQGSFLFADMDLWKNHPEVKTAVFFNLDNETGRSLAELHKKVMEAIGIRVFPPVHFPLDTVDFSPFATKIVSMNPGVVRMPGSAAGTQFGLQLKALHMSGYKGPKSHSVFNLQEAMAVCGKEAIEGLIAEHPDPTERSEPPKAAVALRKAYETKYGVWNYTGLPWVSAWNMFLAAITKADSLDPDKIVSAMEGIEYESTRGYTKMIRRPSSNETRTASGIEAQYTIVVKDGKIVPLNKYSPEEVLEFIKRFKIPCS